MKIAICDSNISELELLKNLLYCYSNSRKLDFFVEKFSSGENLLKSNNEYSIIFSEYNLSGINGLELAENLRKKNIKSKIIFISKNTDFIIDCFKVSPYRFLKKPIINSELFSVLDDFFNSNIENHSLLINDKFDTYCLNTSDIFYLEANNKHCYIHLENQVISCNKTMARVMTTLPQKYFKKINRAFIVNLNYISKYNNEYVFLTDGRKLHITRNYYTYFKQEYINFARPKIL